MYHYIEGKLPYTDSSIAVIDCGGVGYKLFITETTRRKISGADSAKLYCHLSVKEDALDLFGFYGEDELKAFKMLIGVSGVGPKVAVAILSVLSPLEFASAVMSGNSKLLTTASGVGAKLAERISLELRDKVGGKVDDMPFAAQGQVNAGSPRAEAVNALAVLGYTRQAANEAVLRTDPALSEVEDIIKEALKLLSR